MSGKVKLQIAQIALLIAWITLGGAVVVRVVTLNASEALRTSVRVQETDTDLELPGQWRYRIVRFAVDGCEFQGVVISKELTTVWHSPNCPCGREPRTNGPKAQRLTRP